MYGYEWTDEYGIFRLTADAKLQKEIRPVFKEELDFFNMSQYWDYPDTDKPLLWAEGVRRYVLNGFCIAEARGGGFYSRPEIVLNSDKRYQLQPIDVKRLYEVNKNIMNSLEQRSIAFIREQHDIHSPENYAFVCAFSGGKDSIALLDLCAKALAPSEFYVVFSDTGMELSDTYKALSRASKKWEELRFLKAKSQLSPIETWEMIGPPASRLRWCCSVHKSVPTILLLKQIAGDNVKAIVYDGVRAEESLRRSKYTEVAEGVKNTQQVNCHAILHWSSAEVFIYLLYNDILVNDAYRKGIYRVGCMMCPMSARWQDALIAAHYPNEIKPFMSIVETITLKAKGKLDKSYVEGGGWKVRAGGNILPNGENRVSVSINNNRLITEIKNGTQNVLDLIQIFGSIVDDENGNKVVKSGTGEYRLKYSTKDNKQFISVRPFDLLDRFEISALKGIANKAAYCIGCKACVPQCPTGAFQIIEGKIQIRSSKCVHCFNCITYTDKSCVVAKSLQVKVNNMGNPDQYKNFGFRQNFLEHFMQEGIDCFNQKTLGTGQYHALKHWLFESGVTSSTDLKKIFVTTLGERLIQIGAYSPFTWAILWANMAYNSVVCRCFCLNAEIGSQYSVLDIADMLDDAYSETTRKNAASALVNTFKESPIGAYLGQGLPIVQNLYLRDGWSMPDGVALLYSLYLYAEHTGRHSFTLTELIKVHETPDAPGVSPADIYGLDNKKLRDCIQGLALTYPEHIRVSFINDLDNIILDSKYSSVNILDLAEE